MILLKHHNKLCSHLWGLKEKNTCCFHVLRSHKREWEKKERNIGKREWETETFWKSRKEGKAAHWCCHIFSFIPPHPWRTFDGYRFSPGSLGQSRWKDVRQSNCHLPIDQKQWNSWATDSCPRPQLQTQTARALGLRLIITAQPDFLARSRKFRFQQHKNTLLHRTLPSRWA